MKMLGRRRIKYSNKQALLARTGGKYFQILKRDKYCCVVCGGHTWKKYLIVHHLDGNVKNNKMNNLVTVCKPCHAELHGLTLRFSKARADLIMELRNQNMTYQEVGDYLGISRQRVHQILKAR